MYQNKLIIEMSAYTQAKPVVLSVSEWTPASFKFMPPKVNDKGGKSINVISKQTNRSLHISTPLMMTWGINDFVDEKTGEADGKFSVSLNFPNDEYATPFTTLFLEKSNSPLSSDYYFSFHFVILYYY